MTTSPCACGSGSTEPDDGRAVPFCEAVGAPIGYKGRAPDDIDIRLLRKFVVVAEKLHFSRAAQRLFVAQQALSRDIRRLEERLGARLLDRTTRRVALTPAGDKLLAQPGSC